jgi:hypothetical protein
MRDHKRQARRHCSHGAGDSAGPEHRHIAYKWKPKAAPKYSSTGKKYLPTAPHTGGKVNGVPKVRPHDIRNADGIRGADVDRVSVGTYKRGRGPDGQFHELRGHRPENPTKFLKILIKTTKQSNYPFFKNTFMHVFLFVSGYLRFFT